jgi:hypothetical protein
MRRDFLVGIGLFAAVAAGAGSALAADLPVRPAPPAAAPAICCAVPDWPGSMWVSTAAAAGVTRPSIRKSSSPTRSPEQHQTSSHPARAQRAAFSASSSATTSH